MTSMDATASEPNMLISVHFFRTARYLLIRFPMAPCVGIPTPTEYNRLKFKNNKGVFPPRYIDVRFQGKLSAACEIPFFLKKLQPSAFFGNGEGDI